MTEKEDRFYDRVFRITYRDRDGTLTERRATILCGTPPWVMTIIDVDKRRIRHLAEGGIEKIVDVSTSEECDTSVYWNPTSTFPFDPEKGYTQPQSMALTIRRQIVAPVSILLLIAEAAEIDKKVALDRIIEYAKRECRYAVSEGWVPEGSKAKAWPLLRDLIGHLEPKRYHLDAYVKTIKEDWGNPKRFAVIGDAMNDVAVLRGAPTGDRLTNVLKVFEMIDQAAA